MEKFITTWFYAELRNEEVKGIFSDRTEYRPDSVNYDSYAELLAKIYNDFDQRGYDVVNVIPMQMGETQSVNDLSTKNIVSYSITRGATVVGKRRN